MFKWILRGLIVTAVALPLIVMDFFLPTGRVVYIVGTEVKRSEQDAPDGMGARDVRYITADDVDTRETRVYRNEDAWFYLFKVNSADIQGRAQSLQQREEPTPALIRYYGYRFQPFSLFNNVISLEQVEPGTSYTPYTRIVFFSAYLILLGWLAVKWRSRHRRRQAERRERQAREEAERVERERVAREAETRSTAAVDDFLNTSDRIH